MKDKLVIDKTTSKASLSLSKRSQSSQKLIVTNRLLKSNLYTNKRNGSRAKKSKIQNLDVVSDTNKNI